MKNCNNIIKERWEKVSGHFAHLLPGRWLGTEEDMFNRYKESVLNQLDCIGKTVIDYGCGGGFLGKLMLKEYRIKKYIGVDIAKRSLDHAKENLKDFDKTEFILIDDKFKLNKIKGDILISIACIQHFPVLSYLKKFLKNVNASKIRKVVLQIRHGEKTVFDRNCYEENRDLRFACRTNEGFVTEILKNYKLVYSSEIDVEDFQFLFYDLRGENESNNNR